MSTSGLGDGPYIVDADSQATFTSLAHLHAIAEAKCQDVAQHVVSLVRRHLGTSFFEYDASLVRDGCFFAGFMLTREDGADEQGETCLRALSEMRWCVLSSRDLSVVSFCFRAFSKSEERIETLKLIWEGRQRADRPLPVPAAHNTASPPDPPLGNADVHTASMVLTYLGQPDGHQSTQSDRQRSATVASSPGLASTSQVPDEERTTSYHDSSISSGSSNSPYTPIVQPMVPSYAVALRYGSKHEQMSHRLILDHGQSTAPLANSPVRPELTTNISNESCYQYVEQDVHPDISRLPQYLGATSEQQGYVGLDETSHPPVCDTGQSHLTQENNYTYTNNAPYSYS